jgi:hypothetical protein
MSRHTYQTVYCCSAHAQFDPPQNASATAMPIIAEARTRQNRHFFRSLLSCSLSRVRTQVFVPRRKGSAHRCAQPETGPEDAG